METISRPNRPGIRFDWTISLGHVGSVVIVALGAIAAYYNMVGRVDKLDWRLTAAETAIINQRTDFASAMQDQRKDVYGAMQTQRESTDRGFDDLRALLRRIEDKLDAKADKPTK